MKWVIYWCTVLAIILLFALHSSEGVADDMPPAVFGLLHGVAAVLVGVVVQQFYIAITKREKGD